VHKKSIVIACVILALAAFICWRQYKSERVATGQLMFYKEAIFRDNSEIKHEEYLGKGFHLVETVAGKTYLIRYRQESSYKGIIEGYEMKNRIVQYR